MNPHVLGLLADERRRDLMRDRPPAATAPRRARGLRGAAAAALILGLAVGLVAGVSHLSSASPAGLGAAVLGLLGALAAVERVARARRWLSPAQTGAATGTTSRTRQAGR